MASSPGSPAPNHRELITDHNAAHDDDDEDDVVTVMAALRPTRLSYQSSPTSKIRKAVDHATPPSGGESPPHQFRRRGAFAPVPIPFHPIVDCHRLPSLVHPFVCEPSPNSTTNPPTVSQTQAMDVPMMTFPSLPYSDAAGSAAAAALNPTSSAATAVNHRLSSLVHTVVCEPSLTSITNTIASPMAAFESLATIAAAANAVPLNEPTAAVTKRNTKTNTLESNRKAVLNNDILTFSRSKIFDANEVDVDPEEFHQFYKHFLGQTRVRFQEVRETKKSREAKLGERVMRSTTNESDLTDDDAVNIETTNQKRLSRCHWEDIIKYSLGQKLALYFRNDPAILNRTPGMAPNTAPLLVGVGGAGYISA